MKQKSRFLKKKNHSRTVLILACVAVSLLILVLSLLLVILSRRTKTVAVPTTVPTTQVETTPATTAETTQETTETAATEAPLVMLENMAALYAENPDVIGYVRVDDTKLDYPVMYTPDNEEKYIHADFNGKFSVGGLPFIDKDCSMDPESTNLIIYGHNMNNGTAFRTLMGYDKKTFWEQHPTIYFSTLYEERTYEIVAAFYDRVYYKYEDVFKFYNFVEPTDEADFNYAMEQFKEKSLYDTGVTASYGDHLITLVTCAYHTDNGRFVVVAREIADE